MPHSHYRMLTTRVGSLPRSEAVRGTPDAFSKGTAMGFKKSWGKA